MLFNKISIKEKALFYENIANLLEGGVTLLEALNGMKERLPAGRMHECIDTLVFYIEGGDSVNVAMRKLPVYFHEGEIAIVESGEETGMLSRAFTEIARDFREQAELRGKIVTAITYPFIVMFFLILAIIIVMVYVIPQLVPIIAHSGSELPIITQALINTSTFIQKNILILLGSIIAIILIAIGYVRTDNGRMQWDKQKLILPLIGSMYKNYLMTRVMSTYHLLSSSGISIVKTLRLTGASSNNVIIEKLFSLMSDDIAHGKKVSESMRNHDKDHVFFTADILQMIESGEKTSTLHIIAEKIARQYKREVDLSLATMVKFIEPGALLLAGVFVLWFAVAIFGAIMQIVSIAGIS